MSAAPDPSALAVLRQALPGVEIRMRRMRRGLLTARRDRGGLILTLHPLIIDDPDCTVFIKPWLAHRGQHGTAERLRRWLEDRRTRALAGESALLADRLAAMPVIGGGRDLAARIRAVHAAGFADLDLPAVRWSRRPPQRRLRHLRFGCYRRSGAPIVEISPRLDRPWVAGCFLDHVLHHELCHHRQARTGVPRSEGVHSARFRAWERAFPGHADALLWERHALPWLLDDKPPPWYRIDACDA